jgi:hypothetical protein
LSKQEVLCELQGIMEGRNYSWHYINDLLQARFEEGSLEFSLTDGDVLFEWNNLCHEKQLWEKRRRLSVDIAEFNMDCLINLKILPFQAGLGIEGNAGFWFHQECADIIVPRLVTSNMDKANVSTVDLWAGPKDLKSQVTSKLLVDDDTSASDSEGSDYVNEYETEDEDFEREDESNKEEIEDYDDNSDQSDEVETEDDEDIEGSGVDVDGDDLGEDESGEEEIDNDDSSDQSDEMETENEDVEGLGVKIVDVDDEYDISDLEL